MRPSVRPLGGPIWREVLARQRVAATAVRSEAADSQGKGHGVQLTERAKAAKTLKMPSAHVPTETRLLCHAHKGYLQVAASVRARGDGPASGMREPESHREGDKSAPRHRAQKVGCMEYPPMPHGLTCACRSRASALIAQHR